MPDLTDLTPLTDDERDAFDALDEAIVQSTIDAADDDRPLHQRTRVALMRARVNRDALPEEVAVVVAEFPHQPHQSDDEVMLVPVAIVTTPELFDALQPPEGAVEVVDES